MEGKGKRRGEVEEGERYKVEEGEVGNRRRRDKVTSNLLLPTAPGGNGPNYPLEDGGKSWRRGGRFEGRGGGYTLVYSSFILLYGSSLAQ